MPPVTQSAVLGRYWRRFHSLEFSEFSGGLNVRDAATELAPNETPDAMNVTLDERGAVVKRLGYNVWNASPAANLITYQYASSVANKILHYSAADGKLYSDPGTGVLTLRHTFTTGSAIGLTDFAGNVYANTLADGLYASADGVTWTAVTATDAGTVPKGSVMSNFQNKLWVADPTSNQLTFSAPGDATKWSSTNGAGSNHVREGNDFGIVNLYGGAGSDFQTKPTLLVGKRSGGAGSLHRVIDPATGDYVTLDQTIGPAGPLAVTSLYGRIYLISTAGVFATDGISPLVPVGQKVEPIFHPTELDYSKASGFCAGVDGDKVLFSVTRQGSAYNDLSLEFYPLFGAFTTRTDAAACYVTYKASGATLLAASPSVVGQVFRMNTGGNDNGAAIKSWFLTKVFEPLGEMKCRLQRVRAKVRTPDLKMQVLTDFAPTGDQFTLSAAQGSGFVWGTGGWAMGAWGSGDRVEDYAEMWPRVAGRAFQLRFDETSSLASSTPKLLETGAQQTVGGWALYSVNVMSSLIGFT